MLWLSAKGKIDLFLRRSAASVGAVYTLFHRNLPHLELFPLGVQTATIRVRHQGHSRETRRDLDEAVCTSSHFQPFLDPVCAEL
jgi:hypothetical protein